MPKGEKLILTEVEKQLQWSREGGPCGSHDCQYSCSMRSTGTEQVKEGFELGTEVPHLPAMTLRDRSATTPVNSQCRTQANPRKKQLWASGRDMCLQWNRGFCPLPTGQRQAQLQHLWPSRSPGSRSWSWQQQINTGCNHRQWTTGLGQHSADQIRGRSQPPFV